MTEIDRTEVDRIVEFDYLGEHHKITIYKHKRNSVKRSDEEIIAIEKDFIDRNIGYEDDAEIDEDDDDNW
tara:strand:- start:725 stop:934 length:210 start_codon:yes stop_codon:yes gene_type:complete